MKFTSLDDKKILAEIECYKAHIKDLEKALEKAENDVSSYQWLIREIAVCCSEPENDIEKTIFQWCYISYHLNKPYCDTDADETQAKYNKIIKNEQNREL